MKKSIVAAMACAALAITSDSAEAAAIRPAIVGGQEAALAAPWAASLRDPGHKGDPDFHFCTGTVVAPRWVLTAASCTELPRLPDADDIEIRVGSLDRTTGGYLAGVREIRTHGFSSSPPANDIALLRLDRPVPVTPAVIPAQAPAPGATVRALGWGITSEGATTTPIRLRQLDTQVLADHACDGGRIGARERCVGGTPEAGICLGDGPVFAAPGVVVGTASRGAREPRCGGVPFVVTDVTRHREWVCRTIQGLPADAPVAGPRQVRSGKR